MKSIHVLLVILLALAALGYAITRVDSPRNATGVPHVTVTGMKQVGDGLERAEPVFTLGVAFGTLVFAAALTTVYIGVPAAYRSAGFKLGFSLSALLLLGSWVGIVWTYHGYIREPHASGFFLGFPAPTAWLIYGVWLAPAAFVALYIYGYRRWIFPPEAQETFNRLMAERSKDVGHG